MTTASLASNHDLAREALRRIASGVTVLTVNHDGLRHGTTVSAIVPVSRDPLVLGACLRSPSGFTRMAKAAKRFCVNVLAEEQGWLASRFADPQRRPGDAQFQAVAWRACTLTGAPLLEGCLAHMTCEVLDDHHIGDHDLLVAQAVSGAHYDGTPLISFAGSVIRQPPKEGPP
ncbi:flavin reductase family protein [Allorhizocola rhizosphaerae]|uniref:flavin reductase family protein n=1 Tax=Allorhizocola rhizosphaerae TaxID=1872709 RepID=UPI0013C2E3F0|nr:flavin reductase family protein [Allorhizocola rhizosphaerae]